MKQVKSFKFILMLLAFALSLILLNSCDKPIEFECQYEGEECPNYYKGCKGHNEPVSLEYFKQGQILLPDYACNDTLIVRDAAGLNKAIAYVEQFNDTLVETDGEIDSLFHVYCDYYIGSYEDQFQKLKALEPTWDSLKIASAINED